MVNRLPAVTSIYLFGSRAYGSGSLRSDIDLLVYSPEQVDVAIATALQDDIPPLDIFRTYDMQFAESVINGSKIRAKVPLSLVETIDAVLLWEHRQGLNMEFSSWDQETRLDIKFVKTVADLSRSFATKIFIGHGRSSEWLKLRDYLTNDLRLLCDDFEAVSVAGIAVPARLEEMLSDALLAFLVATAEDEAKDGTKHMRENVVHEIGLFQGRLGLKKAIILLENGCSDFSNVSGLIQIRFDRDHIDQTFRAVKRVLEREHVLPA
jgi:predicted nucleotidyltransferase